MRLTWLIDFEDSFTYNVAAEIERLGMKCEVLPWTHLLGRVRVGEEDLPQLIVLGPGPGHPDDYGVGPRLATWWTTGIPIAGICLGHQLIGRMLGLKVAQAMKPMHGERLELHTPKEWRAIGIPKNLKVQRYNSLAIPIEKNLPSGWVGWEHDGEYIAFKHHRSISYQFHPESVGTSCPQALFRPLLDLAL